jgi:hypothetical protein
MCDQEVTGAYRKGSHARQTLREQDNWWSIRLHESKFGGTVEGEWVLIVRNLAVAIYTCYQYPSYVSTSWHYSTIDW